MDRPNEVQHATQLEADRKNQAFGELDRLERNVKVVVDDSRTVRRMTEDMKNYEELPLVVYEVTLGDGRVVKISEPYDDNTIFVEVTLLDEREYIVVNHGRGASDTTWQLEVGPIQAATKEDAIVGYYGSR